jgi:hypothetical protein
LIERDSEKRDKSRGQGEGEEKRFREKKAVWPPNHKDSFGCSIFFYILLTSDRTKIVLTAYDNSKSYELKIEK